MDQNFWNFNLGNLLTIVSFLGGGIWFIATMKNAIALVAQRLQMVEAASEDQKLEIKKLADILVTLGKYEERFLRIDGMIEDLRHGRGLIRER